MIGPLKRLLKALRQNICEKHQWNEGKGSWPRTKEDKDKNKIEESDDTGIAIGISTEFFAVLGALDGKEPSKAWHEYKNQYRAIVYGHMTRKHIRQEFTALWNRRAEFSLDTHCMDLGGVSDKADESEDEKPRSSHNTVRSSVETGITDSSGDRFPYQLSPVVPAPSPPKHRSPTLVPRHPTPRAVVDFPVDTRNIDLPLHQRDPPGPGGAPKPMTQHPALEQGGPSKGEPKGKRLLKHKKGQVSKK